MKWFRKSFLKKIYKNISTHKDKYCCCVNSWHKLFICWKDLKEVKEVSQSFDFDTSLVPSISLLNCRGVWFLDRFERLDFLNECISKFETK